MEKNAVNNLVLTLSKMLKGERFIVFRKLKSQIKKLENCKGPDAEKRKLKAKRLREQSSCLMKADLKSVAVKAFTADEPWQNILARSSSTEQELIEARLIGRPRIQEVVTEFRNVNSDWKEWVPKILESWKERQARIKIEIPVVSRTSEEPATEPVNVPKVQVKKKVALKGNKTPTSAVKPPLQKKVGPLASKVSLQGATRPPLKKVAPTSSKMAPTDGVKSLIKKKVAPAGAKVAPRAAPDDTLKPQVTKKILHGAGEAEGEDGKQLSEEGRRVDTQPKGLPVQSPGSLQEAVTGTAKAKIAVKESPPRKFAAGDPFFWSSERTGSDDEAKVTGPRRPPFSSPMKQRLPPSRDGPAPRRSFAKSAAPSFKRRHSTAFGPGPDNRGRPQGFKKTPFSAGKCPRDTNKDTSEDSDLHPSWAAKRQAQKAVVAFQGKKVTFS